MLTNLSDKKEMWDGVDKYGRKLGIKLIRGEKTLSEVYHFVCEVVTVTVDGEVLVTQRDSRKPFPLMWEITGGSALCGETPIQCAVRELKEETGICVGCNELLLLNENWISDEGWGTNNGLYNSYLVIIDKKMQKIKLQEGETIDYKFLSFENFKTFVTDENFAVNSERMKRYLNKVEQKLLQLKKGSL